jgi:hypothetical protein
MKKTLAYFLYTMLLACIVCACNDRINITQIYAFDLQCMPYPAKIIRGETAEIRCQLVKEGYYEDAAYYIRYFQNSGTGELRLDDGRVLTPNDLFLLDKDVFRLYYTSHCTDQQTIDVCIEDSFGQVVQKSFAFQNESVKEEPALNLKYTFTSLPVPNAISQNDTVEIRCRIEKEDDRNTSTYAIRYFQPTGKGTLLYNKKALIPNELYPADTENFTLYYVSDCVTRQTIDVYIVDSNGQTVQKTFAFESLYIEPEPETDYSFGFETLPVPKSVVEGETIEIRCQIKRADSRNDTKYAIRYFQPDGKGSVKLENGSPLVPNDLYEMESDVFRLYYTSRCNELQTIDIYITDMFGRVVQKSFGFTNEPLNKP